MQLNFATEDELRAKAALLLYAAYRSRPQSSSLNGLETWTRFTAYIRGACLKSETTAEFITSFCRMAGVGSIKPRYLETSGGMVMLADGSLVQSSDIKEFQTGILEDDRLMRIYENEGQIVVMLIRERIQREKMEGIENEDFEGQV